MKSSGIKNEMCKKYNTYTSVYLVILCNKKTGKLPVYTTVLSLKSQYLKWKYVFLLKSGCYLKGKLTMNFISIIK